MTVRDLVDPRTIVQLGVAPSRIDLLASLDTIPNFESAWQARAKGHFSDVPTQYISLDDLIREKEVVRRAQDLARMLRMARKRRL